MFAINYGSKTNAGKAMVTYLALSQWMQLKSNLPSVEEFKHLMQLEIDHNSVQWELLHYIVHCKKSPFMRNLLLEVEMNSL